MDIISYLLELLQQRKEVGITDLGTFYKKKSPGRYDKETQSFLPPSYVLQFTSELKEEEVLPNFISTKRNISIESANYYIAQFTDEIKQKLEVEHEAELPNFGRLFFTEHAGLSFEPIENISYGSEFYGLPSLQETVSDDADNAAEDDNEDVFEEIAEAPVAPPNVEGNMEPPIIENIELDEVRDDLKNTLSRTDAGEDDVVPAPEFIKEQHEEHPNRFGHRPESETPADKTENVEEEIIPAPDFIKEQHEEHPNRFGHTPESELDHGHNIETPESDGANEESVTTTNNPTEPVTEAPEFIKEQHEEHPKRFGHAPESETLANEINRDITSHTTAEPKKYINLEEDKSAAEPIIEAPEFIKEQHAEHPNRFGHDPMIDEPLAEESKPIWPKVIAVIILLAVIGAVVYFLKPDLFNQQPKTETTAVAVVDSPKTVVDTAKARQDSIAKTDSILKANQVASSPDTVTKSAVPAPPSTVFHVIAISFQTEAAAQRYIAKMKKEGYDAKIVKIEGTRKKVSIANFSTKEEAEKQKDILQKKLKGQGFYVKQLTNNTQP
ncbi:SPOR domain-containing protein [Pedobacter endophyticus]|uniref:SPOR domain-containing protein n=1 Tax=Pedobacter endophyticus TaxID=2789740 RepID=A0A7S9KYQ4_9SPHI|nr:SPOR domain-containing protein [Pedobacter endophyticus]QPH39317.1 SPOR domain-containing protein [Pedobacter endophyticus]